MHKQCKSRFTQVPVIPDSKHQASTHLEQINKNINMLFLLSMWVRRQPGEKGRKAKGEKEEKEGGALRLDKGGWQYWCQIPATLGVTGAVFGSSRASCGREGGQQEGKGMEKERNVGRKFNMWDRHIFFGYLLIGWIPSKTTCMSKPPHCGHVGWKQSKLTQAGATVGAGWRWW